MLVQIATEKAAELPDVPLLMDLVTKPEDKQMLELMLGPTAIARSFVAPPGLTEARATLLRRAFDATMTDPAFVAEVAAMQGDIQATKGEDVQKLVARMYATPKPIVDRAKKYLAPPNP